MLLSVMSEAPVGWLKKAALFGAAGAAGAVLMMPGKKEANKEPERIQAQTQSAAQAVPSKKTSRTVTADGAMSFIEPHEGRRYVRYLDTKGIPTVGVGFNLRRPDARRTMQGLGHNYEGILQGTERLTDGEIDVLFRNDVTAALRVADSFAGLKDHPFDVQLVLVDMAFNLGPNKLAKFVKFRQALQSKDYAAAAAEMVDSEWYRQVGNRSRKLVGIMSRQ